MTVAQGRRRAQPRAEPAGAGADPPAAVQRRRVARSTSSGSSATSRKSRGDARAVHGADRARAGFHRRGAAQGAGDRTTASATRRARSWPRRMGGSNALTEGAVGADRPGRQVAGQEPGARPRAAPAGQHRGRRRAAGQGHRRDRAAGRRAGAGGQGRPRDIAFIRPGPGRRRSSSPPTTSRSTAAWTPRWRTSAPTPWSTRRGNAFYLVRVHTLAGPTSATSCRSFPA